MSDVKKLRNYVLWFGNDIELASIIAKYLSKNGEEVYNYYFATEEKETSEQWLFWEYEESNDQWTRSKDINTLSRLPRKDLFSRKAKLEKINKIAERRNAKN